MGGLWFFGAFLGVSPRMPRFLCPLTFRPSPYVTHVTHVTHVLVILQWISQSNKFIGNHGFLTLATLWVSCRSSLKPSGTRAPLWRVISHSRPPDHQRFRPLRSCNLPRLCWPTKVGLTGFGVSGHSDGCGWHPGTYRLTADQMN